MVLDHSSEGLKVGDEVVTVGALILEQLYEEQETASTGRISSRQRD